MLVALAVLASADSPLTSTDLASAYAELPAVRAARSGVLDDEVLRFLLSDAPTDHKLAVVNALGWQGDGNARRFAEALARARGVDPRALRLDQLGPADRAVLGYLLALDDYFELTPLRPGAAGVWGATPIDLLSQAAAALPDDFAVHYVRSLVAAQAAMDTSWCAVWLEPNAVLERFPESRRNLRPAAVEASQSYIALYRDECAESVEPGQLDMLYDVELVGPDIVVATQGGGVVWREGRSEPVATELAGICPHALSWGGNGWVGCDRAVLQWDGKRWTTWLPNTDNDADYYDLVAAPDALYAVYGGQAWRWWEREFVPADLPMAGAYDVAYQGGRQWAVSFLDGVYTGGERVDGYPGRDPRSFEVDALGRLWVADFGSGIFRLDGERWVRMPGVAAKGSAVAVDVTRERTWLLHYTDGLTVLEGDRQVLAVDLAAFDNLRDVEVDGAGVAWVASWRGLVRVGADGGARAYRVAR